MLISIVCVCVGVYSPFFKSTSIYSFIYMFYTYCHALVEIWGNSGAPWANPISPKSPFYVYVYALSQLE